MKPIHDPALCLLGVQSVTRDPRTLQFGKYAKALPPPPASVTWSMAAGRLGMMANDMIGDCVFAALGHQVQIWTGNANPPAAVIPDAQIVAAYSAVTGYNPAIAGSDQGSDPTAAARYFQQTGIAGHGCEAWVEVNLKNPTEIMQAIATFGSIGFALALPTSAQGQVVWDTTSSSPSDAGTWGEHMVPGCDYAANVGVSWLGHLLGKPNKPTITVITWGAAKTMTIDFLMAYGVIGIVYVTKDWIEKDGKSPSGFDLPTLLADVEAVTA